MSENYQLKLDKEIESLHGERPELLLHSCCGPCSSYVLEYLTQYYKVTLLWYNPNIWPPEENDKRLYYQRKIIDSLGLKDEVPIMIPEYDHAHYLQAVSGRRSPVWRRNRKADCGAPNASGCVCTKPPERQKNWGSDCTAPR